MAQTTNQTTDEILKQLSEPQVKTLMAALAKLQLHKSGKKVGNDNSSNKKQKKEIDLNALPSKSTKPKLIGRKSTISSVSSDKSDTASNKSSDSQKTTSTVKSGNSNDSNSNKANDSDASGSGTSTSSSSGSKGGRKRGSRGSRRGRRRRLKRQKQLQTEKAAKLLATMVGAQSIPPVQQTLSPPQQFFKYPNILPKRDVLHDPMTGENRPVWSVTVPMVCHKTNTPFYAQCSTARHGYCSRCGVLRKGNKPIGSCCPQQGCNERLTAKYHRWYPGLIRLEPYGKERCAQDYEKNKKLFASFNITWNNQDELDFVLENYLLMKVFLVAPDFDVAPLHVERAYMIGVFAGRKFHTGALARKFLRDGLRLMSFRADFPKTMKSLPEERAKVVEEMNQIFFQGRFRCYFHGHQSNIEGWYDPTQVDPATVQNYLQAVCQRHAKSLGQKTTGTTTVAMNGVSKQRFQYPKNPQRFAFAHQQQAKGKPQVISETSSDSGEESSGSYSNSSAAPSPRISYIQAAPQAISYVPVYISGGQQIMTYPTGAVAFQPTYGVQAIATPRSGSISETSSQTSEYYPLQATATAYHPQAQFVSVQQAY